MKIDIWYDFVCPFCFLGETKLEMALKQLASSPSAINETNGEIIVGSSSVKLNFRSFQLSPYPQHLSEAEKQQRRQTKKAQLQTLDPASRKDIHQLISEKYGMPYQQAKRMNDGIVASAKAVGLNYRFDLLKPGNTEQAHRIAQFAKDKGLDHALILRYYAAYFEEGAEIEDTEVLLALAASVGLDPSEVQASLDDPELLARVNADQAEAKARGITGVPYFIIDDKYAISGAQGVEVFLQALQKAAE